MPIDPTDDGLAIPEVGPWARRKYHYLSRYLDAFTTAMRDKWPEMHYIDLFAGAGFARVRDTNAIVASSAVIAANLRFPFTKLHLCDANPKNVDALQERLRRTTLPRDPIFVAGDANDRIEEIMRTVPERGSLCVTFADPFGLHLDFETVRTVAAVRSDLIILLADNMDALRNWATYYYDNPQSNLDRFMGEPGWRDALSQPGRPAERLRERYQSRLKGLGYRHFAHERIVNARGHDIYVLLFASRSKVGVDIWHNVSTIDEGGQRNLF